MSKGILPADFNVNHAHVPGIRDAILKLARLGYTENLVKLRLGLEDLGDLQWRSVPIHRSEGLAERDPLSLAIDMFLLQGAISADELGRLFNASEREALERAGLLETSKPGLTRARASLFPVGDRLVFSDHAWPQLLDPGSTTLPYDQVMWIGMDSRLLARCTTRRAFHAALDLCTGSGVHALLAAAHCEQVVAVDISPRAASCARFNALASGTANVEVRTSDLYEAVQGERFDLITANPPFVPSPLNTLQFRDGGRSGEDVQKRIIAGLPRHLAPGGVAQIFTELGERDREPIVDRLREWLGGAPMDIHMLRLGEYTAAKYAIGHARGDDYRAFLESIDEWKSNLRAQGYLRVVSMVISFQWSDAKFGPPWERVDESTPPRGPAGAEIDAVFRAERLTRLLDLRQVLRRGQVSRAGSIALLDAQVLGSGVHVKAKATLLGQALKIEHHLDPLEREILNRIPGRMPMADLIRAFCEFEVDEPSVIEAARSLLRRRLVRLDDASAHAPQFARP